jgi:hypothetical protein
MAESLLALEAQQPTRGRNYSAEVVWTVWLKERLGKREEAGRLYRRALTFSTAEHEDKPLSPPGLPGA